MTAQNTLHRTYTIMEAAKLSGLPESTLRYYETIGLIGPIRRDPSSKHRVYSEDDFNSVLSVACLNATGMSIDDMRAYMENAEIGANAALGQVDLLEAQCHRLVEEERYLKLRQKYLKTKVKYWKAISERDEELAGEIVKESLQLAAELKNSRTTK
jgi:DNA-binding transcriptional MerR regulator